jgi:hypothetical protein
MDEEVKFVHGDFSGSIFKLTFMVNGEQIRVHLQRHMVTFPHLSLFQIKNKLSIDQFNSLFSQICDFTLDLN